MGCNRSITSRKKGGRGRAAEDNRKFINAVFWILRTGAPWRDLPPEYGGWKNTHRRFTRWRDKGVWQLIFETLMQQVGLQDELEWAMVDATFIKCHIGIMSLERLFGVPNPLIIKWIRHYAKILSEIIAKATVSKKIENIEILEMDELFSFCKKNKTESMCGLLLTETGTKFLILK